MCYNDLATDPTYSYHYYLSNVLPVNDVLAVALPDLLPALACKFVPKFLRMNLCSVWFGLHDWVPWFAGSRDQIIKMGTLLIL